MPIRSDFFSSSGSVSVNKDCLVMGILNLSPDSFSGDGLAACSDSAMANFQQLYNDGADIVDIGGMASGPGSVLLDSEAESERVTGFLKCLSMSPLRGRIPVSVDTFRSEVLYQANRIHPISCVNDISALRYDPDLVTLVAEEGMKVVLMYSKESGEYPLVSDRSPPSGDVIENIRLFFEERIEYACSRGISPSQIVLDPGMGAFLGTDPDYSWDLIRRIDYLLDYFRRFPILTGVSRKRFIGNEKSDRDVQSKFIEFFLIEKGVSLVRTHNVAMFRSIEKTRKKLSDCKFLSDS